MCNWDFHQVLICFWVVVYDKEHNALYLMIVFASECCTSKAAYVCVCVHRFGNTSLQDRINSESFTALSAYYGAVKKLQQDTGSLSQGDFMSI